ncbi:TRAF3-interacting protein 1 isoform X2 [Seriola lalandi dorsalis]|uniref:TRAF3-interacting protein 1 isoform X2 n=1 Tax=Seriola lalandi dorsalis TaxID=1841481 RepID=UPI000C6FC7C1|nr:TRAF3-interacting protein 1 isoform X2 [Seriola lalandi dorsalis]XP_056245596.1 TRAF3-interacting protein 1 isoform X2 [Seriola aureovittata]
MNAALVRKTQDTLGKVIKKPPLTEKLLSKPPFRYLHDIFSEVIRTTGFMKGLYGENEMKSDNVKDKDSKIVFLQKAIDVVMLVSGEPLAAKPARIVAGHEPEKTNELLQAIAKCCLNKLSSEDAVKRVLAGEKVDMKTKASTSRSQDKENREGRERHLDSQDKKKITERSGSRDQKDPDQPKEQESRRRDGEKEHHRDRERSDKHHRSEQDRGKDRDKDKSRDRERDKDRDKGRVKDRDKVKDRERDREREKEREKTRERDSHREGERDKEKRRERDKEREKERERHKEGDERNKSVENGSSKARVSEEPQQKPSPEEPSKTAKPVPAPADAVDNQSDSPARLPRPSSAKGQRRRPKIGGQDESDSEGDGDAQLAQRPVPQDNGDAAGSSVPSDMTSRRIARPGSARPAPPRVKRQESYTDVNSAERLSSAKPSAPVIMEGKKLSEDEEDEDEQFLVEEAVPPPSDAPEMEVDRPQEIDSEEKHGGLVKKILETKKDYELSPSSSKSKDQNLVSEAAQKKEQDMVTREIERLRSSIQTVCRSSLPLGKIMDYIQEDMDAMQAELHTWRRENKEHAQALLQEQRATDRAVEPLKVELAELEQLIKDQQDKICAVRSNILKNEEKIQKMVTGINFSSRT